METMGQRSQARHWLWALAGTVSVGVVGCGAAGPSPGPAAFPLEPFATLSSDSGQYQVQVRTSPQPPVKGVDAVQYQIADAAGAPVDGLVIDAVPWMPSHGHGTSAKAVVEPQDQGVYEITNVYLFMDGHWELRSTLTSADGAGADGVTPVFDVP
jgi:hypothetical protein